jgi:DNA-binding CsgD family transcriptional regulator
LGETRIGEPVERRNIMSSTWQKSIPSEAGSLGGESKGFLREPPPEKNFCHGSLGHGVFPPSDWLLLRNTLGLSVRELQIAQSVFADEKQEAIAWRLGISPGTVNTYMQRLFAKLEVRSRPQLTVRVIAAYLLLTSVSYAQMTDEHAA